MIYFTRPKKNPSPLTSGRKFLSLLPAFCAFAFIFASCETATTEAAATTSTSFKITFDKNFGTGDVTGTVPADMKGNSTKTFKIPANELKVTGMSFIGWADDPGGSGAIYKGNDDHPAISGPITLYAQWRFIPVTSITGIASKFIRNTNNHLEGKIIPEDSTYKADQIVWTVKIPGEAKAEIISEMHVLPGTDLLHKAHLLNGTTKGTFEITATVPKGKDGTADFTQDFLLEMIDGSFASNGKIVLDPYVNSASSPTGPGTIEITSTWDDTLGCIKIALSGTARRLKLDSGTEKTAFNAKYAADNFTGITNLNDDHAPVTYITLKDILPESSASTADVRLIAFNQSYNNYIPSRGVPVAPTYIYDYGTPNVYVDKMLDTSSDQHLTFLIMEELKPAPVRTSAVIYVSKTGDPSQSRKYVVDWTSLKFVDTL